VAAGDKGRNAIRGSGDGTDSGDGQSATVLTAALGRGRSPFQKTPTSFSSNLPCRLCRHKFGIHYRRKRVAAAVSVNVLSVKRRFVVRIAVVVGTRRIKSPPEAD